MQKRIPYLFSCAVFTILLILLTSFIGILPAIFWALPCGALAYWVTSFSLAKKHEPTDETPNKTSKNTQPFKIFKIALWSVIYLTVTFFGWAIWSVVFHKAFFDTSNNAKSLASFFISATVCLLLGIFFTKLIFAFLTFIANKTISGKKHAEQRITSALSKEFPEAKPTPVAFCVHFLKVNKFARIFLALTPLLLIGMGDFGKEGYWYYTLLKLAVSVVCLYALIKFKTEWIKWAMGVVAVLYNPILPLNIDESNVWAVLNLATIAFLWLALRSELRAQKKS